MWLSETPQHCRLVKNPPLIRAIRGRSSSWGGMEGIPLLPARAQLLYSNFMEPIKITRPHFPPGYVDQPSEKN
jgi:hypothetical protein